MAKKNKAQKNTQSGKKSKTSKASQAPRKSPPKEMVVRAQAKRTSDPMLNQKFIFVTGGVVSSIGKGLSAASLGTLLEARGLKVTLMKFDPYLNVDPGTMSPLQHGEVYVTEYGSETDKY